MNPNDHYRANPSSAFSWDHNQRDGRQAPRPEQGTGDDAQTRLQDLKLSRHTTQEENLRARVAAAVRDGNVTFADAYAKSLAELIATRPGSSSRAAGAAGAEDTTAGTLDVAALHKAVRVNAIANKFVSAEGNAPKGRVASVDADLRLAHSYAAEAEITLTPEQVKQAESIRCGARLAAIASELQQLQTVVELSEGRGAKGLAVEGFQKIKRYLVEANAELTEAQQASVREVRRSAGLAPDKCPLKEHVH